MLGSFISRSLIMAFGYLYPAYECFKVVEKKNPEIEQLLFWCQYWILIAGLTVSERIGDNLISWLPMYSEAKLAFFIYLWHPRTKGTSHIYKSFLHPFIAKHETQIDHYLLELRVNFKDFAIRYSQMAVNYGQKRLLEILHYVSAQSALLPTQHDLQKEPNVKTVEICPTIQEKQSKELDSPSSDAAFPLKSNDPESETEKIPTQSKLPLERGKSDASQQGGIAKESPRRLGRAPRGRWNLFQSTSS